MAPPGSSEGTTRSSGSERRPGGGHRAAPNTADVGIRRCGSRSGTLRRARRARWRRLCASGRCPATRGRNVRTDRRPRTPRTRQHRHRAVRSVIEPLDDASRSSRRSRRSGRSSSPIHDIVAQTRTKRSRQSCTTFDTWIVVTIRSLVGQLRANHDLQERSVVHDRAHSLRPGLRMQLEQRR